MELQLDLNKKYTFADYLTWFDDKRRELWDGFIKMMTPAPNLYHQASSGGLYGEIYLFLKQKKRECLVFSAPLDVRFPKDGSKSDAEIDTVVQPDIVIVCDKNKIDKKGCLGAPDFIAEIISPSTAKRDMEDKYKLYEKHGVKEYWIVFPNEQFINAYFLVNGEYRLTGVYTRQDKIPVKIFNGEFEINLIDVFEIDDDPIDESKIHRL